MRGYVAIGLSFCFLAFHMDSRGSDSALRARRSAATRAGSIASVVSRSASFVSFALPARRTPDLSCSRKFQSASARPREDGEAAARIAFTGEARRV